MFFLLRLLVRRDWLAACLFVVFFSVAGFNIVSWQFSVMLILQIGLIALAMVRFGLLALASAQFAQFALIHFPATLNFSVWYAGMGLAPLVAVLALAVFAFYTSLGGQRLFQGSLLEN